MLEKSDLELFNKYKEEMCIQCKNRTTDLCHITILDKIGFVTKNGKYKETYKEAKCAFYDEE